MIRRAAGMRSHVHKVTKSDPNPTSPENHWATEHEEPDRGDEQDREQQGVKERERELLPRRALLLMYLSSDPNGEGVADCERR
ncbi:MAG: hypothetical protein M3Q49_15120 [Actinomycetota bacterium]|jgi:hypothetical protein|nr:hypothetical protein [Actinomycetota bacterium]